GQEIARGGPYAVTTAGGTFRVNTYYKKLRGRGPNAPEKRYVADGAFQIDVHDQNGRPLLRKALPFQAKTPSSWRAAKVAAQAKTLLASLGGGLIIRYGPTNYQAAVAATVVEARGKLRASGPRRLGEVLAHDFLECRIGRHGLYYDEEREEFALAFVKGR